MKKIMVVKKSDVESRREKRLEAAIRVDGYSQAVEPKSTLRREFYRIGLTL